MRSNALKTLNAQRFPTIEFHAEQIGKTAAGYVMRGALTIHGATRAVDIELSVAADGALSLSTDVSQRAYGIKPFSMAMGSLKVRRCGHGVVRRTAPRGLTRSPRSPTATRSRPSQDRHAHQLLGQRSGDADRVSALFRQRLRRH
ncbi:yceI-like domain protein [Mycobacteroides abscessus]|nr:yceI-like domain protein [Mycobacteroides abscessus]